MCGQGGQFHRLMKPGPVIAAVKTVKPQNRPDLPVGISAALRQDRRTVPICRSGSPLRPDKTAGLYYPFRNCSLDEGCGVLGVEFYKQVLPVTVNR